jgi:hypothetical protein
VCVLKGCGYGKLRNEWRANARAVHHSSRRGVKKTRKEDGGKGTGSRCPKKRRGGVERGLGGQLPWVWRKGCESLTAIRDGAPRQLRARNNAFHSLRATPSPHRAGAFTFRSLSRCFWHSRYFSLLRQLCRCCGRPPSAALLPHVTVYLAPPCPDQYHDAPALIPARNHQFPPHLGTAHHVVLRFRCHPPSGPGPCFQRSRLWSSSRSLRRPRRGSWR